MRCASGGVEAENRSRSSPDGRGHHEDVRGEQAEELATVAGRLVVDVDAVAVGDDPDEAAGSVDRDRDGSLLARELRGDGLARGRRDVSGRDLLSREDVDHRGAPVEVRGIGERAGLDVVLRQRGDLVEPLLRDDRAGGALRDEVLRDERPGVAAARSFTLERYWIRYATSRIAASTRAATPAMTVQRRDPPILVVAMFDIQRLLFDGVGTLIYRQIQRTRTARHSVALPISHFSVTGAPPPGLTKSTKYPASAPEERRRRPALFRTTTRRGQCPAARRDPWRRDPVRPLPTPAGDVERSEARQREPVVCLDSLEGPVGDDEELHEPLVRIPVAIGRCSLAPAHIVVRDDASDSVAAVEVVRLAESNVGAVPGSGGDPVGENARAEARRRRYALPELGLRVRLAEDDVLPRAFLRGRVPPRSLRERVRPVEGVAAEVKHRELVSLSSQGLAVDRLVPLRVADAEDALLAIAERRSQPDRRIDREVTGREAGSSRADRGAKGASRGLTDPGRSHEVYGTGVRIVGQEVSSRGCRRRQRLDKDCYCRSCMTRRRERCGRDCCQSKTT